MLAQLAAAHPDIVEQGGDVLGVAPAAPYQATHLRETSIPYDLLLDPGHRLGRRLGMGTRSLAGFLVDVRGWGRYVGALARHRRQGRITQGPGVLPAIAVVDADAAVTYLYRGTGIADYPPLDVVLDALEETIDG